MKLLLDFYLRLDTKLNCDCLSFSLRCMFPSVQEWNQEMDGNGQCVASLYIHNSHFI